MIFIIRFQMVLPKTWRGNLRPVCIQLGGTGDHVCFCVLFSSNPIIEALQ